ncbi:MAG: ATP-binding protein [Opitutaceae bacterium]|nr:ATP-binding protein [Opitutaceae bacterium]
MSRRIFRPILGFDRGAAQIAGIYFVVSVGWILGSSGMAAFLAGGNARLLNLLENAKGIFFVTVTGAGLYLMVALTNARARRQAEEKQLMEGMLSVAQRLEALGTLAGTLIHDFNNILAVIRGMADMVKLEHYDVRTLPAHIEQIERSVIQAEQLIQQLMLFMRNAPASFAETDVGRELRNSLPVLRQAAGRQVEVTLKIEENLPDVELLPSQFNMALLNLVLNARDALEQAARQQIIIEAKARELSRYHSLFQPKPVSGTHVTIAVADTGCGIARSDFVRVFSPFFTTKPLGKGTGLGLASVLKVMQTHRGWVELQSEVGVGTQFTLFLPAVSRPAADGGAVQPAQ